jgi:hypothetical protein
MKLGFAATAALWAVGIHAEEGWKLSPEVARAKASRVMLVVVTGSETPVGGSGTCRIAAITVAAERGGDPAPGTPVAALVPCRTRAAGADERGRWVSAAELEPGRLARLYLARNGKPRDLELLAARAGAIEPSAEEADKRQVWRLLHAGSGDSVLADTDDVREEAALRVAWVKINPKRRERNIVQIITRVGFDCGAGTQTLQAWYARTGSNRVESQGVVPEEERRPSRIAPGSPLRRALASICAADLEAERPFENGHAPAAEHRPVPGAAALNGASAAARLEGGKGIAAEAIAPEGGERGMGGAGHRVLVHTPGRDEYPADDVVRDARRGRDHHQIDLPKPAHVGVAPPNRRLVGEEEDGGRFGAAVAEVDLGGSRGVACAVVGDDVDDAGPVACDDVEQLLVGRSVDERLR